MLGLCQTLGLLLLHFLPFLCHPSSWKKIVIIFSTCCFSLIAAE
ncbi:hypothetical protein NEOC95_001059 [Neochlamydia sp. AcF95]|nr:hypothetical protein [Neochlamydia sp. AcF95]